MITAKTSGRVAIRTYFIGATDHRGPRIKAVARGRGRGQPSITVDWNDYSEMNENHEQAAIALCNKMDWQGELVGGSTNDGYVWVFVNDMA